MPETQTEIETQVEEIKCVNCKEFFEENDLNTTEGGQVCNDCYRDYVSCYFCKEMHHPDNIIEVNGTLNSENIYVCDNCENKLNVCEECNENIYPQQETHHNGGYYCQACFDEYFFCCQECDEYYHMDDRCTTSDDFICESCGQERSPQQDLLSAKFLREPTTYNKFPFKYLIGIESEVYINGTSFEKVYGWGITSDGSLETGGIEFYSAPFRGDQILKGLKNLEKATKRYNAYVNHTCGIHIHVGLGEPNTKTDPEHDRKIWKTAQNIAKIWWKFEPIAFSICNEDRISCTYAIPIRRNFSYKEISMAKTPSQFLGIFMGLTDSPIKYGQYHYFIRKNTRYFALNLNSLAYRGSVEFRCYHGTLDIAEIYNWAYVVSSIVWAAENYSIKEIKHFSGRNFQTFMRFLKIPPEIEQALSKLIATKATNCYTDSSRTKLQKINKYIQSTKLLLKNINEKDQASHIMRCQKIVHMLSSIKTKGKETHLLIKKRNTVGFRQIFFLKFLLHNKKYYRGFLEALRKEPVKQLSEIEAIFSKRFPNLEPFNLLAQKTKEAVYYYEETNKTMSYYGFTKKEIHKLAEQLDNDKIKISLIGKEIWSIIGLDHSRDMDEDIKKNLSGYVIGNHIELRPTSTETRQYRSVFIDETINEMTNQ